MFKNVTGQKLTVFAFDATTNLPKSGDAANITAYVNKDDGGVTVLGDTSASESEATNAKGYYTFDLTQAETNADKLAFSAKSTTANVVVVAVPAVVYTVPASWLVTLANTTHTLQRLVINNNTADAAFHVLNSVGNAYKAETSADNMHAAVFEAAGANAFGISGAVTNTNLATTNETTTIMSGVTTLITGVNVTQVNGQPVTATTLTQHAGSVAKDSTNALKFTMSAAGLTFSLKEISKPGAATAAATGTITSRGNGVYEYVPAAGETDTAGGASLRLVASTGETVIVTFDVAAAVVGGGGTTNITVAPIQTQVISPHFTVFGPIIRHLSIPQNAAGTYPIDVRDASDLPVALTGKTLKFNVHDRHRNVVFTRTSGAGDITVTGTGNNVANVTVTASNSAVPGDYEYKLWNDTDGTLLATGDFKIPAAPR